MQIHETAFIVSTYRSYHENISKDIYAKLWNNSKTEALIPSIMESVSKKEAILHSLRNRFFHESLQSFFDNNKGGTLINFGAGFSMYQFMLNDNVSTIEIDKKDIIEYKKSKINLWTKEGKLPKRNIQYLSLDFNLDSEETMINSLKKLITSQPTFIILEGVLFFLNQKITNKLFRVFKKIQNTNDIVGSVSYLPEIENTKVYKRLLNYFDSNNDTNDSFNHQTIPNSYYRNLDGYSLKKHIDEYNLSKIYTPELDIKDKNQILNENMYLLERTD
ncbi:Leucine carboxyl methyltransferase [Aquimarina amphilecti]|uniref:Leucine carboxyl methyltransferase n=1 Tax=Aquimarina amphilecti TaxID=1038014 RepID=A0A1H7U679_AQUAM|nr:class I SAM-dependent methyltransferase [Aquimarina amphilecti]SEL92483.1 Leucine carboxyl methyltransferase [Aquimarina amphilecti]